MRVSPFRGIRYNQRIAGDLAQVICPPYDVISPEQQKLYYERDGYNAIRIEHPAEHSEGEADDKYTRAATTFRQWLKQGVLQIDDRSAFYLHDYCFMFRGETRRRRGLIARVKLEPWGSGIYPHEETGAKAKADRLYLMRACQASFSPLICLYQDAKQEVISLLSQASQDKPAMAFSAKALSVGKEQKGNLFGSDESHTIWAITDPKFKQQIEQYLSPRPLYMADGHHRYETALIYQEERMRFLRERDTGGGGTYPAEQEAFNYVMTELVEFSDPGLVVLPVHRLVRGIRHSSAPKAGDQNESADEMSVLREKLERFFILKPVPLSGGMPLSGSNNQSLMSGNYFLGVLGLKKGYLVLLTKREDVSFDDMMPAEHSSAYKQFEVSILNHIILDRMLGLYRKMSGPVPVLDEEKVVYTMDADEAQRETTEGKYDLAFLLNPPQLETVRAIANAGDRMPRKSTYFYPKAPAGLIINPLD